LNIASAHVTTFGERAVDAFYVTDLTGAKIISPQRQVTIKRQLLDVFKGRLVKSPTLHQGVAET